jgi:cellulose synthase operon protein C
MTGPDAGSTSLPSAPRLPDIDELFEAVELEAAEQRPAEYAASSASPGTPDADPAAPYVRAAAVLCTFDPATLRPLADPGAAPPAAAAGALVGYSALVIDPQGNVRGCLREPVRRAALAELLAAGRVGEALRANPASGEDTRQRVFGQVLTGSLPPLEKLRLDELTALQAVEPWVDGLALPRPLPAPAALSYHLERERLLDPFRHLLGRFEAGTYVEHFRGRARELRRLREYVDVAASEGLFETTSRGLSAAAASLFNLHESPPLVIHGPGGVGKSSLMAKFLLQHAEAHLKERFPFAYLDFDRPDLAPVDARTILAEIARQLTGQYARSEPAMQELRRRLLEGERPATEDPSIPVLDFYQAYEKNIDTGRPLLLVFDTFEEVQQRSRDEVEGLFVLLDRLQGALPRLRAVLVGRAPVTPEEVGVEAENLPLLDLDDEAARGFLASRGIRDAKVAGEIIALTGRQPLALKLGADLALAQGVKGVREAVGGPGVLARFRSGWTRTAISGRLYQRLLNHLTDPEARKLAHPGLVLRRITPEIIRDVLAVPCGLGPVDDARAAELFERLRRQVSLVAPAERGVLRHRADVRQVMLPLILAAEAEAARQIQESAVRFYAAREGTAARAEEIYHRLLLGEPPRAVAARWTDGLEASLSGALDELPPRAQAFLAARLGEDRPDEVWREADLEDWERHAEQRVRQLLARDEPERAEAVLQQRSDRSGTSRLLGLQALVLDALGRENEAHAAAERAADHFERSHVHADLAGELRTLAARRADRPGGLFRPDEIRELETIFTRGRLVYSDTFRRECFGDIPRDYLLRIPVTSSPQQQLLLDLQWLNSVGRLPGGSHPLVLWLEQAHRLRRKHPEEKALQAILRRARRRAGEEHERS